MIASKYQDIEDAKFSKNSKEGNQRRKRGVHFNQSSRPTLLLHLQKQVESSVKFNIKVIDMIYSIVF